MADRIAPKALGTLAEASERMTVEQAEGLVRLILPGWGWRICQCHLSTDAWLFPDWNDPAHSERLRREFPPELWESGTAHAQRLDLDIRPPVSSGKALRDALLVAVDVVMDVTGINPFHRINLEDVT